MSVAQLNYHFSIPVFRKLDVSDNLNIQKFVVKKSKKYACFKWTYGIYGKDYRVAALSLSYLTVIEIIMQSLKAIGQFKLVLIHEKSQPLWTDRSEL